MKFIVEKDNYFRRLKKEYLLYFLLLSAVVLFFHQNNPDRMDWSTISAILIILAAMFWFLAHRIAKINFYEVELTEKQITLKGNNVNEPIEIILPIEKTNVQFKHISQGRGKVDYYMQFTNDSAVYEINKLLNWEYKNLLKLFNTFKELKKESKSIDDKLMIELIEKRVH